MTISPRLFSLSTALGLALSIGFTSTSFYVPALADETTLKGSVIQTEQHNNSPTVNYDEIKNLDPGTTLEMVVSTSISTGVSIEGDEFFSKVTKDYVVDGKVVIPRGTLVHGAVENIKDPKRAGRNGWIATKFDYMITPDGREIQIAGDYSNRDSKFKAGAKVVGKAAGYTAMGGIVGALMVVKYGGLPLIAATNGYALAGGAAVGGAVGLTASMVKKGKNAMISPGAEIRVKLAEPLSLPTMNLPDAEADNYTIEGLNVKVLGMQVTKDPFGEENEVTLTLDITNSTEHTFSTFDIGLEDEYGNLFYPSPFGDSGLMFRKLTPNTKATANVSFNVDSPKRLHKLVFFKQYTREPLAKVAIVDSMTVDKKTAKALNKKGASKDSFDP